MGDKGREMRPEGLTVLESSLTWDLQAIYDSNVIKTLRSSIACLGRPTTASERVDTHDAPSAATCFTQSISLLKDTLYSDQEMHGNPVPRPCVLYPRSCLGHPVKRLSADCPTSAIPPSPGQATIKKRMLRPPPPPAIVRRLDPYRAVGKELWRN